MADEALTAGAVARRLGVAVTTLRTWHQRYGLGPSQHVPGQHRRYTPEDMDRLQVMRRLTAQGVAPAEAAAWARRVPMPIDVSSPIPPDYPVASTATEAEASTATHPRSFGPDSARDTHAEPAVSAVEERLHFPDQPGSEHPSGGEPAVDWRRHPSSGAPSFEEAGWLPSDRPGVWDPSPAPELRAVHPSADASSAAEDPETFSRLGEPQPTVDMVWPERNGRTFVARDGGGHAIRTGRAGPAARGLARAAMRLDGPALRDILEMTVTDRGVIAAWEEVIMPVLIGVGERYAATKRFIEVEHILSRGVTEVMGSVSRPPSSQIPQVLLAAADEEQHTLPLEALAAALAQAGVSSRLLGARVPAQAVGDAIARTGPAVLVLWSQLPGTADPAQWGHVLSSRHRPLLVAAAGPGWRPDQLPEGVTSFGSLAEAVRLVSAVTLPADRPR